MLNFSSEHSFKIQWEYWVFNWKRPFEFKDNPFIQDFFKNYVRFQNITRHDLQQDLFHSCFLVVLFIKYKEISKKDDALENRPCNVIDCIPSKEMHKFLRTPRNGCFCTVFPLFDCNISQEFGSLRSSFAVETFW